MRRCGLEPPKLGLWLAGLPNQNATAELPNLHAAEVRRAAKLPNLNATADLPNLHSSCRIPSLNAAALPSDSSSPRSEQETRPA